MIMDGFGFLGAGLAVALSGIGAAVGEAMIAVAAFNSILRNPDMRGKFMTYMILFIALTESCAIYGLIVAFKILEVDPANMVNPYIYIAAGLSVGLSGLAVALVEWWVAKTSLDNMGKNPELSSSYMVLTILGIALIESCAIYGLIIAFKLIG